MFVRMKQVESRKYLQVVENKYVKGKVKQRVICSLGRLDKLKEKGHIEDIIKSLTKFSEKLKVIEAYKVGDKNITLRGVKKIGPDLVFGKLWEELNIKSILQGYQMQTNYSFSLERAIYFSVLQRLFNPSSDREGYILKRDYHIEGTDNFKLHHLYRAINWLGENKDAVEKGIFSRNRDLFTGLNLVFIDTTSIYFEAELEKSSLVGYGFSKDRKPYNKQVIVNVVMDSNSRPLSCDILKGNTPDMKIFLPTAERLKNDFGVKDVCVVCDRGFVSNENMRKLDKKKTDYILGFRLRSQKKEFIETILNNSDSYEVIKDKLKAKEIILKGKRYILCLNEEEKERDRVQRGQILEVLQKKLNQGVQKIIKNSSFKKYLQIDKESIKLDKKKIEKDAFFDGVYCLITNTGFPIKEVVLRYKELWQIERLFKDLKNTLKIRPVFHKLDSTIKGHIFCGFLGLVLMKELCRRLEDSIGKISFNRIRQDLEALYTVEILFEDKAFILRSPFEGIAGKIFQALKIKSPPSMNSPAQKGLT